MRTVDHSKVIWYWRACIVKNYFVHSRRVWKFGWLQKPNTKLYIVSETINCVCHIPNPNYKSLPEHHFRSLLINSKQYVHGHWKLRLGMVSTAFIMDQWCHIEHTCSLRIQATLFLNSVNGGDIHWMKI